MLNNLHGFYLRKRTRKKNSANCHDVEKIICEINAISEVEWKPFPQSIQSRTQKMNNFFIVSYQTAFVWIRVAISA